MKWNIFKSENLNILRPPVQAGILIILALMQMFGQSWVNYGIAVIGEFRITISAILTIALAIGVLLDARK